MLITPFGKVAIAAVVLLVLLGSVYLCSARFSSTAPESLSFQGIKKTDQLHAYLASRHPIGTPVEPLLHELRQSGATEQAVKPAVDRTTAYTYRKQVGIWTWMMFIEADASGNITHIVVDGS